MTSDLRQPEFLQQTGALELHEALPEQLRTEQALPADIANLLVALFVGPYITPMLAQGISALCLNHSWPYATSILSNISWALMMFDTDGKVPDGVLSNLNYMGNWDECLSVQASFHDVDGLIPPKGRKYWWKNPVYINNLYESDNMCLGQTWYLANDMQIFVLSPIVPLPLYIYPTIGQIWLIFLIGLNMFITGYVTDYNGLGPSGGDVSLRYFVPSCRYGMYLMDVCTGWFLHRRRGRRLHMTLPVALASWLVAALTACLVVYGLYDYSTAVVFSLAFEAPMMALENIIFANVGAVVPKPMAPPAHAQEPNGTSKQASS
ncbi:O-acyltransferase like protein-like [Pollicipes pollicipes]|uniref:O-acyltransferase like protein-like n=1 Tax=Pollicipes pollicipes TaxID=41117 RepID=UPI001884954A|nr:O-acyltransferase like protein-like [Pollicipes pollicipes]